MDKENFLKLLRSRDFNTMVYIFVTETSPVQLSLDQSMMFLTQLSGYYGMSPDEGLRKIITHYEKKFHIEILKDKNNKVLMYAGERVRN